MCGTFLTMNNAQNNGEKKMTKVTLQKNVLVYGGNVMIPKKGSYSKLAEMLSESSSIAVSCIASLVSARVKKLEAIGFQVVGSYPVASSDELEISNFTMVRK
jgi:hypothetical protein